MMEWITGSELRISPEAATADTKVTTSPTDNIHIEAVIRAVTPISVNTHRPLTLILWEESEQLDLMEVITIVHERDDPETT